MEQSRVPLNSQSTRGTTHILQRGVGGWGGRGRRETSALPLHAHFQMFHGMNQLFLVGRLYRHDRMMKARRDGPSTQKDHAGGGALPGDVVRRASGDAGFKGVGAIHAHRVEGLVVTETKGIEVDVGLGGSSGARLTWKHTDKN